MSYPEIHILSTKKLDQHLKNKAAEKNILIDERSFIRIEPIADQTVQEYLKQVSGEAAVVFTSANAAEIVGRQANAADINWDIFCLGFATKERVASFFNEKSIAGTADYGTELADVIIDNGHIRKVIFFCADQRRDTLPEKLRARGIIVEEKMVYRTIEAPSRIEKKYNGIVFFSPSAVRAFFEMNTAETAEDYFSIGETTSTEIKKFTSIHLY